jgi:hypothetical protein
MSSNILKNKNKRVFNVKNSKDVEIYKNYVLNNTWGKEGCPFEIEYPHVSVPYMIQEKLVKHFLKLS